MQPGTCLPTSFGHALPRVSIPNTHAAVVVDPGAYLLAWREVHDIVYDGPVTFSPDGNR